MITWVNPPTCPYGLSGRVESQGRYHCHCQWVHMDNAVPQKRNTPIQRLTQGVILQQLDEADVFLDYLLPQSQGCAHILQNFLAGIRQLLPKVVRVERHSLELPGHHLGKHTTGLLIVACR